MKLTCRILFLTDDGEPLRRQLAGEDLDLSPAPLHYGVNTDLMISGAACTLGYTGEILGPWFLEKFKEVVEKDDVKGGGFQVVVGGDAYGSGSSREVAVVAQRLAEAAMAVGEPLLAGRVVDEDELDRRRRRAGVERPRRLGQSEPREQGPEADQERAGGGHRPPGLPAPITSS